MLTLDLTNAPRWHDLAPGVRVQLRPLTTALMVATRSDPAVEAMPEEASDEERAVAFAKALARRAVLAWEGVGDADGNAIEPEPRGHRRAARRLADLRGLPAQPTSPRACCWSRKKTPPRPCRVVLRRGRALLRSLRARLPGLPGAAEPAAHA